MRRNDYMMYEQPEPPKKSGHKWLILLVDAWFLVGLVVGQYIPNTTVLILACIGGLFLIITHFILASH